MRIYRPATVLIGVLFVLLGGLTRLLGPDQLLDDRTRQLVHGTVGQELRYGSSTVTVRRIRFARTLSTQSGDNEDKPVETDGAFVAVEYDAARGPGDPNANEVSLTTDEGTSYRPVTEGVLNGLTFPAPGFVQSGSFVFEVNPSDLTGLTFRVTTSQLWTVLTQDLAVDLAVPSQEIAEELVAGATAQYLVPKPVTRVAS
jgi:hypothetical protein